MIFYVIQIKTTSRRTLTSPHRRVSVFLLQLLEDVYIWFRPQTTFSAARHLPAGSDAGRFQHQLFESERKCEDDQPGYERTDEDDRPGYERE